MAFCLKETGICSDEKGWVYLHSGPDVVELALLRNLAVFTALNGGHCFNPLGLASRKREDLLRGERLGWDITARAKLVVISRCLTLQWERNVSLH